MEYKELCNYNNPPSHKAHNDSEYSSWYIQASRNRH